MDLLMLSRTVRFKLTVGVQVRKSGTNCRICLRLCILFPLSVAAQVH